MLRGGFLRCLVTAAFHEDGLMILRELMEVEYRSWRETGKIYLDGGEFASLISEVGADVLVVESDFVTSDVVERCDLKIIASCRDDPYNVDVKAATARGIPVVYAPRRNTVAVAELTIALMLAAMRRVVKVDRLLKSGKVKYASARDFIEVYNATLGFELGGKKVGIVGLGAIGFEVAKRLKAFDVEILVYDPYVDPERVKMVGGRVVSLEELFRESDVVTVHCRLTPETAGMIKEKHFASMKPTAFFVNLARGGIVDEDALFRALKEGWIAGAALDVVQHDPAQSDNRFLTLDNVVLTPHIGGNTHETIRRQSVMVAEDIKRILRGEKPRNILNPEVLK
ncbi:MAG: 2-hydroxyacid dehydrogenase [Nitrososphaerota archaeon]